MVMMALMETPQKSRKKCQDVFGESEGRELK